MRIALIGTRGVPATYGGFETAVEEVGKRLAQYGHEVTVYCKDVGERSLTYEGMKRVVLPSVKHRVAETLSRSALAVLHAAFRDHPDAAVLFNAANAPLLPFLRLARIPTAVHVDGLEWRRAKWSGTGKAYYRLSERVAVRLAPALIADSRGIASYYLERHGRDTEYIPYGASLSTLPENHRLAELGLAERSYFLVVARLEPENKVAEIVQGYSESGVESPLVIVGKAAYTSPYIDNLLERISSSPRIVSLGGVWDQDLLNQLYAGCRAYLHGHSVGGHESIAPPCAGSRCSNNRV